ncbi:MAG: fused response regulator/phosphatase [Deltaproteobacteria bacterium]|nr:MAG: fused response regulator/phosphatase [Deltaproteobacteria bacterium]
MLSAMLTRQGFEVVQAGSGVEAIRIIESNAPDLILSDWMMPEMNGLDLCQHVRGLPSARYIYFILLTAKSEKEAVAQGLDVGADDFLTKPVSAQELRARIMAGARILQMERELARKNAQFSAALEEIQGLYGAIERDLAEARKMQLALVPEKFRDFGSAQVSLLLKPSGHVGGDLVGMFDAGRSRVAVFSIDVSGHGVASALLTARLAGNLSNGAPEQNVALVLDPDGHYIGRPPQEVATLLNDVMLEEMQSDLYLTAIIAYINVETGAVDIVQCGHPNPAIIRADGSVEIIGRTGLPIGLIEDAEYEQWRIALEPGDRLLFYSDGFTECVGQNDTMLEESGLKKILAQNAELEANDFLEALVWDLDLFCKTPDFPDDLSCALIEFRGEAAPKPDA